MLLEDFRILISTPADEVGGGFLPSANYRGESGAPALQCPFSPRQGHEKWLESGAGWAMSRAGTASGPDLLVATRRTA